MVAENKSINYLTFVPFAKFNLWDVKRYSSGLNMSFENVVRLSEILIPYRRNVSKEEMIKNKWQIIAKINFGGQLFLRDFEEIHTYKGGLNLVPENAIIYSKINVRHGCIYFNEIGNTPFGVSNEYPTFTFDEKLISGDFLRKVLRSNAFKNLLNSKTSGISKARVKQDEFLDIEIPLPTLDEQNRIVASYNTKLQLAQQQEEKAKTLETEIERYLFEELGVEKMIVKPFVKGVLNVFNFSEIFDRWDYNKGSSSVFSILHQSKYPVKTLDEVFNFTNRSWNKKSHKESTFTYVEMGGIDAGLGIVETTNLEVSKAPSRATQTILKGDLIIGTTRPYLKKFAIVTEKNNENIASSAFQIIAPSEDYCLDYLLEYIKSEFGVKQFEYYMTGALYPAITSKDLRRVLIPFPPVEKQKQISGHMNSLKTQIKELNVLSSKNKEEAIVEFEKEIFN